MLLIELADGIDSRPLLMLHALAKLCAQGVPICRAKVGLKSRSQQRAHGGEHGFAAIDRDGRCRCRLRAQARSGRGRGSLLSSRSLRKRNAQKSRAASHYTYLSINSVHLVCRSSWLDPTLESRPTARHILLIRAAPQYLVTIQNALLSVKKAALLGWNVFGPIEPTLVCSGSIC